MPEPDRVDRGLLDTSVVIDLSILRERFRGGGNGGVAPFFRGLMQDLE